MPPAPAKFSMTAGWPKACWSLSASRRPVMSGPVPGGNPTRISMVLSGKAGWAVAIPDVAMRHAVNAATPQIGEVLLAMCPEISALLERFPLDLNQRKAL